MTEVIRILSAIEQGEPHAAEQLLPLVYGELRKLAAQKMAHEAPDHTLQATALVHEAYLRIVHADKAQHFDSRKHFFAAAAEAMRRILVEQARGKRRKKRGGELFRADIDVGTVAASMPEDELLDLDAAMTRLAAEHPIRAKLVQLRFYAGLSNDEAAQILGISSATATRYWRYARAWLHREIDK
jgi:RNA polymerase sigma factor (TIGR02999 family)